MFRFSVFARKPLKSYDWKRFSSFRLDSAFVYSVQESVLTLFFPFRAEKLHLSVTEDSVVNSCTVLHFLTFHNKFRFTVVLVHNGNFVALDSLHRKAV